MVERLEQAVHQHAEHDQADDHPQHGADHRAPAQGVGFGHDDALVQHHADVPVHALEVGQGGEGHQQILVAAAQLLQVLVQGRALAVEQGAVGLAVQLAVGVGNDVAVAAQQEGIAGPVEVQVVDRVGDGLQADVAAEGAEELAAVADLADRGDEDLAAGGVDIGLGQQGRAGRLAGGVPGALAPVPVGGRLPVVTVLDRLAIRFEAAEDQDELVLQHRSVDQALDFFGAVVAVDAVGHQVDQLQLGVEPVLDLPRQGVARLGNARFHLAAQGAADLVDLGEGQ
ncbi:hypothetical protein D3C78_975330 [compost metagenome]